MKFPFRHYLPHLPFRSRGTACIRKKKIPLLVIHAVNVIMSASIFIQKNINLKFFLNKNMLIISLISLEELRFLFYVSVIVAVALRRNYGCGWLMAET